LRSSLNLKRLIDERPCADVWVTEAGGGDAVAAAADALRPATSRRTWRRRDAVRLDVEETGPLAEPPVTVITAFRSTVNQFPDQIALGLCIHNVCGLA